MLICAFSSWQQQMKYGKRKGILHFLGVRVRTQKGQNSVIAMHLLLLLMLLLLLLLLGVVSWN